MSILSVTLLLTFFSFYCPSWSGFWLQGILPYFYLLMSHEIIKLMQSFVHISNVTSQPPEIIYDSNQLIPPGVPNNEG
jgi:hypothetical protein